MIGQKLYRNTQQWKQPEEQAMESNFINIFTEKLTFLKCFGQPLLKTPHPARKQLMLYLSLHYYVWKCQQLPSCFNAVSTNCSPFTHKTRMKRNVGRPGATVVSHHSQEAAGAFLCSCAPTWVLSAFSPRVQTH